MLKALRDRWREYSSEALRFGIFIILVGIFGTIIFSPTSILAKAISNDLAIFLIAEFLMSLALILMVRNK